MPTPLPPWPAAPLFATDTAGVPIRPTPPPEEAPPPAAVPPRPPQSRIPSMPVAPPAISSMRPTSKSHLSKPEVWSAVVGLFSGLSSLALSGRLWDNTTSPLALSPPLNRLPIRTVPMDEALIGSPPAAAFSGGDARGEAAPPPECLYGDPPRRRKTSPQVP